jgi:arsenate reductase
MQYFHNPRCSKSRQGLELLKQNGQEPEVILYLQDPPSIDDLKAIIDKLGIDDVKKMMRTKEAEFKEQTLASASQETLIEAMVSTPKLIERPILITETKAAIGRPPEALLDIL